MNAARPFAGTKLTTFLASRVLELRPRKSQAEIATEAGFSNANMMSMLKAGSVRLPLDRVPALALALETDPAHLFLLAIEQLAGDTTAMAFQKIFGTVVTENELDWVRAVREASDCTNPSLTRRGRTAIFGVFGR
jgi:hypothetical protein